uniref:FecR family protein n=1 Tax=Pedobacter schmidteae TaxID=2201271 RepID=UPI000EAC3E86|nr:FecR domain-containing protein [Pedobacter schmidteae]
MKKFETNEEMIYGLIIDDLDGIISANDKATLENWRNTSAANEQVYQEFLNVHLNMNKLFERGGYDTQSSWEVLDKKISTAPLAESADAKRGRATKLWYGIAASILIVLSAGYYFTYSNKYEEISTGNKGTYIILPDSTRVDLNSATTIRYRKQTFLKNRKLELLNGEVFINVINHKLPQFKLVIGELEALDIGTSFNVIKTDNSVHVIVENGEIALKEPSADKQVMLTPGKLGTYDVGTKALLAVDNLNPNYKSWLNKEFIFNEVPLKDVASQLSKVYQEPILVKGNSLKYRKLTARLHYQTLDSVIAVISASLQCKATKSKATYILSED